MNRHIQPKAKFKNSVPKRPAFSAILLFALLILFLFAIQPTDIYNMASPENKALIIFLLSLNFAFVVAIELAYFNKRKLSRLSAFIKTHILFSGIIILTSLSLLYIRHPYMTKNHLFQYLSVIIVTVAVFQLFTFYFILKKIYLDKPGNEKRTDKKVRISDNKTTLNINTEAIIFIKAEGNYVTVFEKNKKYLIRSSLKKILEQNKQSELIRCHKSYIVNPRKIKSISGNSKGYKISLLDYDYEIPASVGMGKALKTSIL